MNHRSPSRSLLSLVRSFGRLDAADPLTQCLAPRFSRSLASQTSMPVSQLAREVVSEHPTSTATIEPSTADPLRVLTTLYSWPEIQPKRFTWYNGKLLNVPLRRDILHRAVIFEADASRQGTASVKWRGDVHGSNRKILPQKGTGRARAGDKKSPIRRGGGKAFGPKPRDFSTDLQRKVYDLAWRTALSHRYRKGEIIITDNRIQIPRGTGGRLLANILEGNQWGKGYGRSMLVTAQRRERLFRSMDQVGEHGVVKDIWDVDVKDLLETGRVVIEKEALDALLFAHASDLGVKATIEFALRASKDGFLQQALPFSIAQQAIADSVALFEEEDQDVLEDEELNPEEDVQNLTLSGREAR